VHINTLELIALFLGYIMFLAKYNSSPDGTFPPVPQLLLWGDNMSANKWFRTFSTRSPMATNALRLFAEYMLLSDVSPLPEWIPGELNVEADDVSRVHELFVPKKELIYNLSYHVLIQQVLLKYRKMNCYSLFLLSPELLSDLSSVVYADELTEVPKRKSNLGRFVPVESISSLFATNTISSTSCFL